MSTKQHYIALNERELQLLLRSARILELVLEDLHPEVSQEYSFLAMRLENPRPGGVPRAIREYRKRARACQKEETTSATV